MRLLTCLALLTATTATVLGAAGPVAAETQTRDDARGDVASTVLPAPRATPRQNADVLRLTGEHSGEALRFTVTVADLAPGAAGTAPFASATIRIRVPSGREYTADLQRQADQDAVTQLRRVPREGGSVPVDCAGLEGRVLGAKDRIVIEVPRTCVRNPRSVRFGGGTFAYAERPDGSIGIVTDDARRDGGPFSVRPVLGTRDLFRDDRRPR